MPDAILAPELDDAGVLLTVEHVARLHAAFWNDPQLASGKRGGGGGGGEGGALAIEERRARARARARVRVAMRVDASLTHFTPVGASTNEHNGCLSTSTQPTNYPPTPPTIHPPHRLSTHPTD